MGGCKRFGKIRRSLDKAAFSLLGTLRYSYWAGRVQVLGRSGSKPVGVSYHTYGKENGKFCVCVHHCPMLFDTSRLIHELKQASPLKIIRPP